MSAPSTIDMSNNALMYGIGVAILFAASTATSNLAALSFSSYFTFAYQKEVCLFLYGLGMLSGIYTLHRYSKRKEAPWKVPQSAVFLPYMVFFFSMLVAIFMTH